MDPITAPLNPWELYLAKMTIFMMAQMSYTAGVKDFPDSMNEAIANFNTYYPELN